MNEDLCEVFTRMGASYAEGFIASGNVIFDMGRPFSQGFVDELEHAFPRHFRLRDTDHHSHRG